MIVLDTHAWIWTVANPSKLSLPARRRIAAEQTLGVPVICTWETAMLVARGRLQLDRDVLTWVRDALGQPKVTLLPLTPEIAVTSVGIELHGDPSDRIIVATALDRASDLVTADRDIRRAGVVRCVW